MLISGSFRCFSMSRSTTSFLTFRHLICSPHVALLSRLLIALPSFQLYWGLNYTSHFLPHALAIRASVTAPWRAVWSSFFPNIPFIFSQSVHSRMQIRVGHKLHCNTWVCACTCYQQSVRDNWMTEWTDTVKIETETNFLQRILKIGTFFFFFLMEARATSRLIPSGTPCQESGGMTAAWGDELEEAIR